MASSSMPQGVVGELCWFAIYEMHPPTTCYGFIHGTSSLMRRGDCYVGQCFYIYNYDDDENSTSMSHYATKHPSPLHQYLSIDSYLFQATLSYNYRSICRKRRQSKSSILSRALWTSNPFCGSLNSSVVCMDRIWWTQASNQPRTFLMYLYNVWDE